MAYKRISPIPVSEGGTGDTSTTAYAVLCGGTTSTGALQSIASVGTSGQLLTSNGAAALPTFQAAATFSSVVTQVFTSSGTYTPTSGMKYCIIEVLGAGGGGGGCANTAGNQTAGGAGGGAGGYARKTVAAATIGASKSVTVGTGGAGGSAGNNAGSAGGTTSVGSTIVAASGGNGGGGGAASGAGANPNFTLNQGGTGGVGSSGDFNANGAPGSSPILFDYPGFFQTGISGAGGSSLFGGGAVAFWDLGTGSAGTNGTNYGSGGSGGSAFAGATGAQAGGNGSDGIVIITEYCA